MPSVLMLQSTRKRRKMESNNHENLYQSPHTNVLQPQIHNDQNHIITHLVILFISVESGSLHFPTLCIGTFPLFRMVNTRRHSREYFSLRLCLLLPLSHYYRLCWHSPHIWPSGKRGKRERESKCTLNPVHINRWSLIITICWDYVNVI